MQNDISISDLAAKLGVTHRTLRFWEEKKLIRPARRKGQRLYEPDMVHQAGIVNALRNINMSIQQIKIWLRSDRITHTAMLMRQHSENAEQIDFLTKANAAIQNALVDDAEREKAS